MSETRTCNLGEREVLNEIYEVAPSLRVEGIRNWYGYFVHWDEVLTAICQAWPDEKHIGYDQSPLELVVRLINERDELKEKNDMNRIADKPRLYRIGHEVIYTGRQLLLGLPLHPGGKVIGAFVAYPQGNRRILYIVEFETKMKFALLPAQVRANNARNRRRYLNTETRRT